MPFSIACTSQKGGAGKSTLARLLARTYAEAGWRVLIADFNTKQKTSVDWVAQRMSHKIEPTVHAAPYQTMKSCLKDMPSYHMILFDGRPDSDTTTKDIAKEANLVLIPTGTNRDDLLPQITFALELDRGTVSKQKMIFVLNKTNNSDLAVEDARQTIERAGFKVAKTDIRWQQAYQNAQDQGRAISETSFPTLNERAEILAAELVEHLNQITGRA
jgi:chromosome partitioning protein